MTQNKSRATPSIGSRVKQARIHRGLSQEELGKFLGVERTAISKIESGRRRLDSGELARLALALARPVDWFLQEPKQNLSSPSLKTLRRRRKAIRRAAMNYGARSIRVFGSVAKGTERSESDIDLLVELEPGRSLLDQAALVVELERLLGRNVDVVTPEGLPEEIRERVLREALHI